MLVGYKTYIVAGLMLAKVVVETAKVVDEPDVVLTGGCFQNRLLAERTAHALWEAGFQAHWHRLVPPNDGGIALGQAVAAGIGMTREPDSAVTAQGAVECASPSPVG